MQTLDARTRIIHLAREDTNEAKHKSRKSRENYRATDLQRRRCRCRRPGSCGASSPNGQQSKSSRADLSWPIWTVNRTSFPPHHSLTHPYDSYTPTERKEGGEEGEGGKEKSPSSTAILQILGTSHQGLSPTQLASHPPKQPETPDSAHPTGRPHRKKNP